MPCFRPLTAWRTAKNGSGKQPLTFGAGSGGLGFPLRVGCGQCVGCRLDHAQDWATRCLHENQMHESSMFLTLTYGTEWMPHRGQLSLRDLQLFFKRLRKHFAPRIRYFACGEYGENLSRPHYHALVWGAVFDDLKFYTERNGNTLQTSETLTRLWGMGHCVVGTVTHDSAGYVARYTLKKMNGDLAAKHYERIDPETGEVYSLRREFIVMSRRPGIGAAWFDKFKADAFPSDFLTIDGKRVPVPDYYTAKLDDDTVAMVKAERRTKGLRHVSNNTRGRLAVREEVTRAKTQTLKRSLHEA